MLRYERKLKAQGFTTIIGVDEAGRGPLAGPVVAAAAVLTTLKFRHRIDDSKILTSRQRDLAYREIIEKSVYGVGIVRETEIDCYNIRQATRMAMEKAVTVCLRRVQGMPDDLFGAFLSRSGKTHVIIDGDIPLNLNVPFTTIINGDALSKSIAGASIIAKVLRDTIMRAYDRIYPDYGFIRHKGYGTKEHIRRIRQFGLCPIHRKSFCLPHGYIASNSVSSVG